MALKNPLSGMAIPLGVVPQMIMERNRSKAKAKKSANPTEAAMEGVPTGMAKGGKVRGDGCCMRGKTKGTMR